MITLVNKIEKSDYYKEIIFNDLYEMVKISRQEGQLESRG